MRARGSLTPNERCDDSEPEPDLISIANILQGHRNMKEILDRGDRQTRGGSGTNESGK